MRRFRRSGNTRRRALLATIAPTVAAAVLGNAFVSKDSQRWFRDLRQPRMAIPFSAFVVVAGVYYVLLGIVHYRAVQREDTAAARLALVTLALNEAWNAALFGPRNTRNGFFGMLAFSIPLVALQKAVADDRPSNLALAPYTAWVIAYDIPWSYRLWRLNPG